MISVTSNAKGVTFAINKSLKAKIGAIKTVKNRFLQKTYNDVRQNAESINAPEKLGLTDAVEIDLKEGVVGVNNTKAPYAPFIEFGTKKAYKVKYPRTAAIAARFKGTPLDFDEMAERIEKQTGLDKRSARSLTNYYAKNGTTPYPFFYPAVFKNKVFLRRALKKALKKRR